MSEIAHCATQKGSDTRIRRIFFDRVEPFVRKRSDSRGEPKSKKMAEGKDLVRVSCCVGVVLADFEIRFVVEESIEYMGGITDG